MNIKRKTKILYTEFRRMKTLNYLVKSFITKENTKSLRTKNQFTMMLVLTKKPCKDFFKAYKEDIRLGTNTHNV